MYPRDTAVHDGHVHPGPITCQLRLFALFGKARVAVRVHPPQLETEQHVVRRHLEIPVRMVLEAAQHVLERFIAVDVIAGGGRQRAGQLRRLASQLRAAMVFAPADLQPELVRHPFEGIDLSRVVPDEELSPL